MVAERGSRPAAQAAPRVAVAELGGGAALVDGVAEYGNSSRRAGDDRGGTLVPARAAGGDVACGDERRRRSEQRERGRDGRGERSSRDALPGEEQLGDLDRVQRRALAQVVAGDEEREAVVDGRVLADPPDENVVAARPRHPVSGTARA